MPVFHLPRLRDTAPAVEPALPGMPVLPPLPEAFRDEPLAVALASGDGAHFHDWLLTVAADHPRRALAVTRIDAARGRLEETHIDQ